MSDQPYQQNPNGPAGPSGQGQYPQGQYHPGQQGGQGYGPQYGGGYGPPPKKKRKWPWILLAIIVLLILAAALGGGGDDGSSSSSSSSNSGSSSGQSSQSGSGEPESQAPADNGITWPGKTGNDVGANAGETVDQEGVVTTAAPLEIVSSILGDNLCSQVTIVNNTGENQSFGTFDWKLLDPTGTIKSSTYAPDVQLLESGETAPGGTASGNVCFDVPAGSPPGQYVVLFEKTFSFSTDRIGWVNQR